MTLTTKETTYPAGLTGTQIYYAALLGLFTQQLFLSPGFLISGQDFETTIINTLKKTNEQVNKQWGLSMENWKL